MIKILIICTCLIFYSTEASIFFDILQFIDTNDGNVTRVRTPDERDRRWKEFAVLDFIGLVEQFPGYTAEEYDVETEDKYVLKLHRISGSPLSPKSLGKPVVYMAQCFLGSSDLYVVTGSEHALAFLLADAGYDVWIGNFRGNTYSKRHKYYSTDTSNMTFWNFSIDDLSLVDLPLFIDTVLEKTNQTKLSYIGYSMGTTASNILLSTKPEYNDKMNVVVSIAPVGIFKPPFNTFVNSLLTIGPILKSVAHTFKIFQILPQSKLAHIFGQDICATEYGKAICESFMNPMIDMESLSMTTLSTIFAHLPAGTSLNVIDHYLQMMQSGRFRYYDFGEIVNKNLYGTSDPPEYDLTKVSSPQAIFYSGNDVFASIEDVNILKDKLQNVVAFENSPADFKHIDFILHRDARKVLYHRILDVVTAHL